MKKSEFINDLGAVAAGWGGLSTESAAYAAKLAEKAGLVFEPEEPELPERVEYEKVEIEWRELPQGLLPRWCLVVPGKDGSRLAVQGEYREACRRYAALGKLRKWLEEEKVKGDERWENKGTSYRRAIDKLDSLLSEED